MARHIIINLQPDDSIINGACKHIQEKKSKNGWNREIFNLEAKKRLPGTLSNSDLPYVKRIPGVLTMSDKAYVCGHGTSAKEGLMGGLSMLTLAHLLGQTGVENVGQINLIMCGTEDPNSILAQKFCSYMRDVGFRGKVIAYNRNLAVDGSGYKHFVHSRVGELRQRLDKEMDRVNTKIRKADYGDDSPLQEYERLMAFIGKLDKFTAVKENRHRIMVEVS
jgi:hypothetical protein